MDMLQAIRNGATFTLLVDEGRKTEVRIPCGNNRILTAIEDELATRNTAMGSDDIDVFKRVLGMMTLVTLRKLYHASGEDDEAKNLIFNRVVKILSSDPEDGADYIEGAKIYLRQ